MSKLAHSNQETMDQIERQNARENGEEDELDAAIAAQEEGCQFCKRILVDENGMERTIEPGNA
jgi:hypothetical protein